MLLAMSQLALFIGLIYQEANISYATYSTGSALAFSGGYMIYSSRRRIFGEEIILPTAIIVTLLPMTLDLASSAIFILAGTGSRGFIRAGMIILAFAYLGRGIWIMTPDPHNYIIILLLSELIRCVGAITMTIAYTRRII